MANAYHKTHQLSSIGMRFFTVYGPLDQIWLRIYSHKLDLITNLLECLIMVSKRDFTYIDDIVEGILLLATQEKFPDNATIAILAVAHR